MKNPFTKLRSQNSTRREMSAEKSKSVIAGELSPTERAWTRASLNISGRINGLKTDIKEKPDSRFKERWEGIIYGLDYSLGVMGHFLDEERRKGD